jgi:transposase-like protein
LTGRVEVDETFIGVERPGPHGRGALGKSLVAVAVELHEPRGYGRARMRIIPNAEATSLREFLVATVEPGSTVVTGGWSSYRPACRDWFVHEAHPVAGSGKQANELLPAVHRVDALCKRWLLGTHQGRVDPEHLQSYLDEFCFRFNRRHSRARGMLFYRLLQYAAAAPPLTYQQLVANPRPTRPSRPVSRVPVPDPAASPAHQPTVPGARPPPRSSNGPPCAATHPAVKWITHFAV